MQWARRITKALLARSGLELSRIDRRQPTMRNALKQLAERGLAPATVIDVGAAVGGWSRLCMSFFPDSDYLLVEPLQEFQSHLAQLAASDRVRVVQAAVTDRDGEIQMYVHPDLVGSSLFEEPEPELNLDSRAIVGATLDSIVQQNVGGGPPYLLKIDSQGAEGRVLAGAHATLRETAAVIVEVSLLPFFQGGPLLLDILRLLEEEGFVPYDWVDPQYRPLDAALAQCDIVLVPAGSDLRRDSRFATPEQRKRQTERLLNRARRA